MVKSFPDLCTDLGTFRIFVGKIWMIFDILLFKNSEYKLSTNIKF